MKDIVIYSTKEVSELLGMHENTIRNMVRDGRLKALKSKGETGYLLFREESIRNYLEGKIYDKNPSRVVELKKARDEGILDTQMEVPYVKIIKWIEIALENNERFLEVINMNRILYEAFLQLLCHPYVGINKAKIVGQIKDMDEEDVKKTNEKIDFLKTSLNTLLEANKTAGFEDEGQSYSISYDWLNEAIDSEDELTSLRKSIVEFEAILDNLKSLLK